MAPNPQRRCIFCDGTPVTGEHLWSEWMHPFLPTNIYRIEGSGRPAFSPNLKIYWKQKDHKTQLPQSLKMEVVCGPCNERWMSGLETEAKPSLIKLITGESHRIEAAEQRIILQWLTLKSMVTDAFHGGCYTPAECRAFKERHTIPQETLIWIGSLPAPQSDPPWRSDWCVKYLRAGVSAITPGARDDEGTNIQTSTFGFGQLAAFTFHRTVPITIGFKTDILAKKMIRLGRDIPIEWPLPVPLTNDDMMELAGVLATTFKAATHVPVKRKTALKIVAPHPRGGTYAKEDGFPPSPLFRANESHDIVCGNCDGVLADGVSLDGLRAFLPPVNVQATVLCPYCGKNNLLPIKGTKPQGKNKGR